MNCLECKKEISEKATYCSDKCRMAYKRRTKAGDLPEQNDPEHEQIIPEQPPTRTTRTDSLFEAHKPNYYKFSETENERNCNVCKKKFKTCLQFMRFCSPKCQAQALVDINELLKEQGLPPATRGEDVPSLEFVSSGFKEIDEITGGFPRKRITEIFGLKGVGKTQLLTRIINSIPDLRVYYVDAENALSSVPDNIDVVNEFVLEGASNAVDIALQKDYDLIVVDSVASLVPRAEIEGDSGDAHMALKARLMSQWMRRIHFYLSKSNTALVFINQQRETLNPYGYSKTTPGGFALPYAASLRLELKSNKADKLDDGQWVHVEVEKSRVCKPYQKTKFKLSYA